MLYTTTQISLATGLSIGTVRAYLRERFPRHEAESWWRIPESDFDLVVRELNAAQLKCSSQPRRVLRKALGCERVKPRRKRQ